MRSSAAWAAFSALCLAGRGVDGFGPKTGADVFAKGAKLPLYVNELTSTRTQAPMDHYQ